jgi:hypothetical protein
VEAVGDCRSLSRLGWGVRNLYIHIIGHFCYRSTRAHNLPSMTTPAQAKRTSQQKAAASIDCRISPMSEERLRVKVRPDSSEGM